MTIKRVSLSELKKLHGRTDWRALRADLSQEKIAYDKESEALRDNELAQMRKPPKRRAPPG